MNTNPLDSAGSGAGMIEFPCGSCSRMLKVGTDAIGRQAKCPVCGNQQTVPATSVVSPTPMPPAGDGRTPAGGSETFFLETPANAAPPNPPHTMMPDSNAPVDVFAGGSLGAPDQPVATPAGAVATPIAEARPTTLDPASLGLASGKYVSQETPTKKLFERLTGEISKIYVGQDELLLGTLVALFSNGHVLIESVPGLGKTLFVRTLGRVLGCDFGRIQFTADLMPSDITGAPLFDMKTQEFRFRPGPVFTQILLADEINRSPAKTHAALLEIMQEFRVTVDGTSHPLKRPFLVMATQNPIESEGTYNLPEAQLDRFMFKLVVNYPSAVEEAQILTQHSQQKDINRELEEELESVTNPEEIGRIAAENSEVRVDSKLVDYVNRIVRLTREWPQFHMGASPRAGIALLQAARTLAAFSGRDYAVPDDVVRIALPALRHRMILTAEAEVEGQEVDALLSEMIRTVEVPRI